MQGDVAVRRFSFGGAFFTPDQRLETLIFFSFHSMSDQRSAKISDERRVVVAPGNTSVQCRVLLRAHNAERQSRRDDDGPVVGFRSGLDVHHGIVRDTLVKHADLVDAAHDAPHLGFSGEPRFGVQGFKPLLDDEGLNVGGDLSAAGHEIIANDVACDGWFVRRSGIISRDDANLLQTAHFYAKPTTHK